jgi:hypothetical protein
MTLLEIAKTHLSIASYSVPEWMLGAFCRRSISFADGLTDTDTRVFWLQSRGLTIDLRLPLPRDQPALTDHSDAIRAMSDLEGWYAHTCWENNLLSWCNGASYQLHNRWPEPAQLRRVGNCMVEFAPSGAYVEDWRLLNESHKGPLIGLELESEMDVATGVVSARQGALIINGEYAGMVLGRTHTALETDWIANGRRLKEVVTAQPDHVEALLNFQTVIAKRAADGRYCVEHSLDSDHVGGFLAFDGFTYAKSERKLIQRLHYEGREIERVWRIDCLEASFEYCRSTPVNNPSIRQWRAGESPTLDRYTRTVEA